MRVATFRLQSRKNPKRYLIVNQIDYASRVTYYAKKYKIVGTARGEDDLPLVHKDVSAEKRAEAKQVVDDALKSVAAEAVEAVEKSATPPAPLPFVDPKEGLETVGSGTSSLGLGSADSKTWSTEDHHTHYKKAAGTIKGEAVTDKDEAQKILRDAGLWKD